MRHTLPRPQRLRSSVYRFVLPYLLCLALFPTGAHGQYYFPGNDEDFTITQTRYRSDYFIEVEIIFTGSSQDGECNLVGIALMDAPYYCRTFQQGAYPYINELLQDGRMTPGTKRIERWPAGSNQTLTLEPYAEFECNSSFGFEQCGNNRFTVSTDRIRPPINVHASDGKHFNKIDITWEPNTDVPAEFVSYEVYADDDLIGVVAGTVRFFAHHSRENAETHEYYVKARYSKDGTILDVSEESNRDRGLAGYFEAGDGEFVSRTQLYWPDLSQSNAASLRVERSVPGSDARETIAELGTNSTGYSDPTGVPGYLYTYYLIPISADGTDLSGLEDTGYRLANGTIRGRVTSRGGGGVPGITVTASYQGTPPEGGVALPCTPTTYCAVTDAGGYYELSRIYYYEGAVLNVVPTVEDGALNAFTPNALQRRLEPGANVQNGVDFVDNTAVTVAGIVSDYAGCPVTGVTLLVDGEDRKIRTGPDGRYAISLPGTGYVNIEPVYHDHRFENSEGKPDTTVFVTQVSGDIDFSDVTVRRIDVTVQAGCETVLAERVEVTLSNPQCGFATRTAVVEDGAPVTFTDLPARAGYVVEVTDISGLDPIYESQARAILEGFDRITVDLRPEPKDSVFRVRSTEEILPERELVVNGQVITVPAEVITGTEIDTFVNNFPTVNYVHRGLIEIQPHFDQVGALLPDCGNPDFTDLLVMRQGNIYALPVEVYETIPNGEKCYVDRAELEILDDVSDQGSTRQRVNVIEGKATYTIRPGEPEMAEGGDHPYQKWLNMSLVGGDERSEQTHWVLVTGSKADKTATFRSAGPEIPALILHDPPGDQSYVFVEAGTSFTTFTESSYEVSDVDGETNSLSIGLGASGDAGSASFGKSFEITSESGYSEGYGNGYFNTITFLQNFSTSSGETFIGSDGDVYIGSAMNYRYYMGENLRFSTETCSVVKDRSLQVGQRGFATTFIYTEQHIRDVLIPKFGVELDLLRAKESLTEEEIRRFNTARRDSLLWEDILKQNAANRENADEAFLLEGNVSIAAGAELARSYTTVDGINSSYSYDEFIESESSESMGGGISSTVGLYVEAENTEYVRTTVTSSEVSGSNSDVGRTIGFVISDNDIGDYLSFDIYRDPDYDVPVFRDVKGVTSCPPEPGTQARDKPAISVSPGVQRNIPIGGRGLFRADISNNSASGEAREYAVRVVSASNPDGAKVYLAGGLINFSPASVFVEPGQKVQFDLEVLAGPASADYADIEIMVYPPCEYDHWQDGGTLVNADTFKISAFFQSSCSPVELLEPEDKWLVNRQSENALPITFGGYDRNNAYLEYLTLDIKRDGEGYQEIVRVDKEELQFATYSAVAALEDFADGNYTIRASAHCTTEGGVTRSSTLEGRIDRSSLAPYGTPEPADGYLRPGQDIKVTFDKALAARTTDDGISLQREDSGEAIPFTVQRAGNELIIVPTTPLLDRPELKGVTLVARVSGERDLSGNVQVIPVEWSFDVNVQPVFWDPEVLAVSTTAGSPFTFEATLSNDSRRAKTFLLDQASLEALPWLTAARTTGTVLADGSTTVAFSRPQDLDPGEYAGEVRAIVDGYPVSLYVQLSNLAVPPTWHFAPEGYQYSMNVVAQFSLDQSDTELSTDTRDLIGAYVNGELRGLSNIEYLPGPDLYRAFLTVFSNDAGGGGAEEIGFRFWRATTGTEYGATEQITFTADRQEGSIASPLILHPAGTFQVIPLQAGWNWISFNVSGADMSRETVFQSIMRTQGGNTITIKSLQNTAEYSPGTGWQGNLRTLEIGKGYLVHLSDRADTLYVAGTPVPSGFTRSVAAGWNWIGYPRPTSELVDNALADLSGSPLDLLKSQTSFAEYLDATNGWEGSLTQLRPGEAYKLRVAGAGTVTFRSDEYGVDPHAYEYNMNVTATLDAEARRRLGTGEWQVVALIDGECRGITPLEALTTAADDRAFLLVSGTAGDVGRTVSFRLYDEASGRDYGVDQGVVFHSDGLVGSVLDPYVIGLPEVRPASLSPNPTTGELAFTYSLEHAQAVRLRLYDSAGRLVRDLQDLLRQETGRHTYRDNVADLSAGVYYLEYVSEAGAETYRLVKH